MSDSTSWSGTMRSLPGRVSIPTTEGNLQELIREASEQGSQVHVQEFRDWIPEDENPRASWVSLKALSGLLHLDHSSGVAELGGGTTLGKTNELLFTVGRGLMNQGEDLHESIARSICTGTQGPGTQLGSLSTQVTELTLVNAEGELIQCSPRQSPEFFKAAQVSLGSLGVITRLKMQTVPAYRLRFQQKQESLMEILAGLEARLRENRQFQFSFTPGWSHAETQYHNLTEGPVTRTAFADSLLSLVRESLLRPLYGLTCWVPSLTPTISRLCGGISEFEMTSWCHEPVPRFRLCDLQKVEFSFPVSLINDVLEELSQMIARLGKNIPLPSLCRFVKGDDIWLSPAYGRDSVFVALHIFPGLKDHPCIRAAEDIFRNHRGRPLWDKVHSYEARDLRPLYPKWEEFQKVRQTLDPRGLFLNSKLKRLLLNEATP